MTLRITLVALTLCACSPGDPEELSDGYDGPGTVVPGSETPIEGTGPMEMDWSSTTPLEFLDLLASGEYPLFTVWNSPPEGWLDEEQVRGLAAQLESQEPACSVVSALSSQLPLAEQEDGTLGFASSTVGREAAFLLEGYRLGHYPPTLGSLEFFRPDPAKVPSFDTDR